MDRFHQNFYRKLLGLFLVCALAFGFFNPNPLVTAEENKTRPQLLDLSALAEEEAVEAKMPLYEVAENFENIINFSDFEPQATPEFREKLKENLFVITNNEAQHFGSIYEINTYSFIPNFVTTDALLNAYHNYFAFLQKTSEKDFLLGQLESLTGGLYNLSLEQMRAFAGTSFAEAAEKNLAFFSIAARLIGFELALEPEIADLAQAELDAIYAAEGIIYSDFAGREVDYSQYKVRGYYAGDFDLERYFRTMMFYGSVNFPANEKTATQSALLMSLSLANNPEIKELWESIYQVTAFFSGTSDDNSFYEYTPLIEEAYGSLPSIEELLANEEAFAHFQTLVKELPPPRINSIVIYLDQGEDKEETGRGFRFMGQRFSFDAAIFQKLIYFEVKENSEGDTRQLPDFLDVPAAYGSDLALSLLEEMGAKEFESYSENMESLRAGIDTEDAAAWSTSLSSAWQFALLPLLKENTEGQPAYAQSEAWERKQLETFAGSYTELKHDTVLYAKQAMAEMGGWFQENPPDTRGFVETEPLVFRRLATLARETAGGLAKLDLLHELDAENLGLYADLCEQLAVIAEKELRNELPSEEEFDLIKGIGGNLEHLRFASCRNEADIMTALSQPDALVTDIATSPEAGGVLQIATGNPQEILVIVPVDGSLRIASGAVYNFYQFTVPVSDRMTNLDWHKALGIVNMFDEEGNFIPPDEDDFKKEMRPKPFWTEDYRLTNPNTGDGLALPSWPLWQEGSVSCQEGTYEASFTHEACTVFREDEKIWQSPPEYKIQDVQFTDIDRNGEDELLLLVWKVGQFNSLRPFG